MLELLVDRAVIAAEGIPPDSPLAQVVVPLGVLFFVGSIFLLLRSNLGTRRGYLVLGTSLFGFLFILSLFWTFGAPGTPQATGPTSLPGMPSDAYQPTWTPFAIDSRVAERPEYQFVQEYPEGFEEVPEGQATFAESGAEEIQSFFASEEGGEAVGDDAAVVSLESAVAPNGFPVVAATYQPMDAETGEPDPEAETVTLFGFFDEGAPLFPGFVFIGASLVLFLLHLALLNFDEVRERREAEVYVEEEAERVPTGV